MAASPTPSIQPSNEAEPEQLELARREGEAYRSAIDAMARENGIRQVRSDDYVVAFTTEAAEGMYAPHDGTLMWAEPPPGANTHMEVVAADAADGRFVPQLAVSVTLLRDGQEVLTTAVPFLWHPFLYHYGINARVPDEGPFDVVVRIEAPSFMRHDPVNGKRYRDAVEATFSQVRFNLGVKRSPRAGPRAGTAPAAGQ